MVLPRATALRSLSRSQFARTAKTSDLLQSQRASQVVRIAGRRYASGGGHAVKAGSDLPWLIGAVAVTIPSTLYLLSPAETTGHHRPAHHGAETVSEEHNTENQQAEQSEEESQEQTDDVSKKEGDQEGTRDSTGDEGGHAGDQNKDTVGPGEGNELSEGNKPVVDEEAPKKDEAHIVEGPESGGSVEGVQFKGATNQGGEDKKMSDTRKHIPDAKGGAKKRIESGYGQELGHADTDERDNKEGANKDKASASKQPVKGETSDKQAGLSNTNTKHSVDITSDPGKSKKGEGSPETAKNQGTVSVNRPPAEARGEKKPENA